MVGGHTTAERYVSQWTGKGWEHHELEVLKG